MKSNEEFIAGIYEKAAVYKEEKQTNAIKVNFAAKAARIAAMVVLCIGLAGVGVMTLDRNNGQMPDKVPSPDENYGIALSSETGDELAGASQFRVGPVLETVTFTGVVTGIETEENRIWLSLVFDENAPEETTGSVVCIKWDMLEGISSDISVGTALTATGALSEYNGYAELVLTDAANLEIK